MADGKKRLRYIDFFKAIAIVLVVLGHINYANQGVKSWIYSFHMPLFFFASGLLLRSDRDLSLGDSARFVWKRFQSVIFPYFLWAMVYSALTLPDLARIVYGSHQTLSGAGSLTSLWFLPTLFLSLLYFAVVRLVLKDRFRLPVKLVLFVAAFALARLLPGISRGYPWCFDVSFCAFGFLLLGNVALPPLKALYARFPGEKKGVLFWALVLILSFAGTLTYRLNVPHTGSMVLMAEARYGSMPLFLLTAVLGIVFTMAAAVLLDILLPAEGKCPRAISLIGENTMALFVLQKPIIKVFQKVFERVPVPSAIALVLTCIGTVICCCLIAVFLNRWLPTAVGRVPQRDRPDGRRG